MNEPEGRSHITRPCRPSGPGTQRHFSIQFISRVPGNTVILARDNTQAAQLSLLHQSEIRGRRTCPRAAILFGFLFIKSRPFISPSCLRRVRFSSRQSWRCRLRDAVGGVICMREDPSGLQPIDTLRTVRGDISHVSSPAQRNSMAERHNPHILHIIGSGKAAWALPRPLWVDSTLVQPLAPPVVFKPMCLQQSLDSLGRPAAPRRSDVLRAELNPCRPKQWVQCHGLSPQWR